MHRQRSIVLYAAILKSDISLSDREYQCDKCGYTSDRDIHSANNMIIMFKQIPTEHREFKPVENTNVFDEAGRLHPLGCN